jgi:hypothetical protein
MSGRDARSSEASSLRVDWLTRVLAKGYNVVALNIGPGFLVTARPAHNDSLQERIGPEAEMNAPITRTQIAAVSVNITPQWLVVLSQNRHPSAVTAAIIFDSFEANFQPVIVRPPFIQ